MIVPVNLTKNLYWNMFFFLLCRINRHPRLFSSNLYHSFKWVIQWYIYHHLFYHILKMICRCMFIKYSLYRWKNSFFSHPPLCFHTFFSSSSIWEGLLFEIWLSISYIFVFKRNDWILSYFFLRQEYFFDLYIYSNMILDSLSSF